MLLFIGTQEIIIIALVILLLFGGAKIPELMRGMGKGVKSFKDGLNGTGEPADETKQGAAKAAKQDTAESVADDTDKEKK